MTNNRIVPGKTKLVVGAVVFCACETIQLFFIIFRDITAVYNFDLVLDENETPNEWRLVCVKTNYVMQ